MPPYLEVEQVPEVRKPLGYCINYRKSQVHRLPYSQKYWPALTLLIWQDSSCRWHRQRLYWTPSAKYRSLLAR